MRLLLLIQGFEMNKRYLVQCVEKEQVSVYYTEAESPEDAWINVYVRENRELIETFREPPDFVPCVEKVTERPNVPICTT